MKESLGAISLPAAQPFSLAQVAQEVFQRTLRSSNIRLFNIPEGTDDRQAVSAILGPLSIRLDNIRVSRVGARPSAAADGKPRAVLVSLSSAADANHIFKNRANLKLNGASIQAAADRTLMEQDLLKKARAELDARKAGGEANITIKYKNSIPIVVNEAEANTRANARA